MEGSVRSARGQDPPQRNGGTIRVLDGEDEAAVLGEGEARSTTQVEGSAAVEPDAAAVPPAGVSARLHVDGLDRGTQSCPFCSLDVSLAFRISVNLLLNAVSGGGLAHLGHTPSTSGSRPSLWVSRALSSADVRNRTTAARNGHVELHES
jgi:hypothetical protein